MAIPVLQRVRWLVVSEAGLDEDAFSRLYERHLDHVLNYVRYRLGPEEAEDITADIFARVWARRSGYDPRKGSQTTWLWAIARNAVTDRLRRRWMHVELPASLPAGSDPHAVVEKEVELWAARRALARLTEVDQEIVALRFGAGHTNRVIATMVGLSEANVAQRLRRALRRMRSDLEGDNK